MEDATLSRYLGFLHTPPLWVKQQFGLQQFAFPEIDPETIEAQSIPEGIRLGHQMEFIFRQCITQSSQYELLLHNAPIRDGKDTLGEVDFILRDLLQDQYLHVELTYKFYIVNPEISEPIHRLMGPNKRDMFFTKLDKICKEQLGLLNTPQGEALKASHGLQQVEILPRVCFKAQLFVPYGAERSHIRPLNTACITGYWIRFAAFSDATFRSGEYYIPYKYEWVVAPNDSVSWMSYYEVLLEVNIRMIKKQAPLLWRKKSNSEFEKFFVVWW